MKVGFTGTRVGMTAAQAERFRKLLLELLPTEFHHGDCIGSDAEAHDLTSVYIECHIHPCNIPDMRAYKETKPEFMYPEKPPLERNRDIVNATDVLVATPKEPYEVQQSGTWATIRYARKLGRKVYLIQPPGNLVVSPEGSTIR